MNEIKHLPTSVPKKDFTFEIDSNGKLTNHRYFGDFKCRIPSIRTRTQIAKNVAFLNAGYDATLDPNTKNVNYMVSYCKFTITEAPMWFIETDYGYDLFDQDILQEVYDLVLEKEEEWIESVWPTEKKDGSSDES